MDNEPTKGRAFSFALYHARMKNSSAIIRHTALSLLILLAAASVQAQESSIPPPPTHLLGHRFLTFNVEISVNQIEATRTLDVGVPVRRGELAKEKDYFTVTPERVESLRTAIEEGFPGGRITWGISWKALHDTTPDFIKIRQLLVRYHHLYGDDITLMPHSWFPNVYNSVDQLNRDFSEGLAGISRMVGNGFRPKSVIAGFLSSANMEYLSKEEGIHVCQGNTWSQFSIDNQDGDGSISYPYYPSREHFCKPAQGKHDFIDCVNLDAITLDFLPARREGFKEGISRLGVGPIETLLFLGKEEGLKEMLHTTALHFDKTNFEANGFAWVTNMWEIFLPLKYDGLVEWLSEIRKRWPDTRMITQGEFGLLWREHYKENSFDYRFIENAGTGLAGSDTDKQIRWFMNKDFRLALLKSNTGNDEEQVIDFTSYKQKYSEPDSLTRSWSLLGDINQKQTRPQDTPRPLRALTLEQLWTIVMRYPELGE
jgi:hypothetical protein